MKEKQYKIICIIILLVCMFTIVHTNSYAATMQMSISKTSAYVGETFTITISGINGRVNITANSNISIDKSGSQWVDGSLTITGTTKAVGTGTVTVTPVDVTTTAAEPEEVTASASRSITIKEKEVPQTTTTTPSPSSKPTTTNTTKKPTTTTTKKQDNFYISNVTLKGIKENGEQIDIAISPEFNKNTYEYTCNIASDIERIDIQKDAGEYTNSVIVTGLEELKEGENIVKLQLSAENHEAKVYTIKIVKEEKIVETIAQVGESNQEETKTDSEEQKTKMISMPLWVFIVMQIGIVIVEVLIICFVPWKKILKIKNKNIDIDE